MKLLASMQQYCRCFFCCHSYIVTSVHALVFTHALAGTLHLLVFLRLLALLLLALLHYECCSIPNAGKFCSLELGKVSLQRPDFYGMEERKKSHSRDRKTFPAFGNAKGLLPGTRSIFCHNIYGWREKFPGISSWIVNPWCSYIPVLSTSETSFFGTVN